jgi:hypothetical protein
MPIKKQNVEKCKDYKRKANDVSVIGKGRENERWENPCKTL